MRRRIDYKKMIEDILPMVEDDFMFEVDCHGIHPEVPYTQEEASELAKRMLKIYMIAHQAHCTAHNNYVIPKKD